MIYSTYGIEGGGVSEGSRRAPHAVHVARRAIGLTIPHNEPHGERRRYYRLTRAGRKRLAAETAVLADIVAHARAQGLLG